MKKPHKPSKASIRRYRSEIHKRKKLIDVDDPEQIKALFLWMRENRPPEPRRKRNKEKSKSYAQLYYKRNKEALLLAITRNQNHRKGLVADLTFDEWNESLKHFNMKCAYCGEVGKLQKEHVHPASLGGGFTKHNIVPACISCNQSKKNLPLDQWFRFQVYYSDGRLLRLVHWIFGDRGLREVLQCPYWRTKSTKHLRRP